MCTWEKPKREGVKDDDEERVPRKHGKKKNR